MAQWWEGFPPTNAAGQVPYVSCLLLFLALLQKFFSVFSSFYPYAKTNMSKFQFNLDRGPAWKPAKADVASSLNIEICLWTSIL